MRTSFSVSRRIPSESYGPSRFQRACDKRASASDGPRTRDSMESLRRALTLLELLVVLSLFGIVTLLVAPTLFREVPSEGILAAEAELRALLAQSRSRAIREGLPVVLTIDPSTPRFWRTVESARHGNVPLGSDRKADNERIEPWRRVGRILERETDVLRFPRGVQLDQTAPRVQFTFLPNGAVFGGSIALRMGASVAVVTAHEPTGVRRAEGK